MTTGSRTVQWVGRRPVSVNKMETLVLGEDPTDPGTITGFVKVRRSALAQFYGSEAAFTQPRQHWIAVDEAGCESAHGDGLTLYADRADLAQRLQFDNDSKGILDAAAALNLMLMRKGASPAEALPQRAARGDAHRAQKRHLSWGNTWKSHNCSSTMEACPTVRRSTRTAS